MFDLNAPFNFPWTDLCSSLQFQSLNQQSSNWSVEVLLEYFQNCSFEELFILTMFTHNICHFFSIFICVSISSSYHGQSVVLVPDTDFHCVGASGLPQSVRGSRDVVYFTKTMTNSFQIFIRGVKKFGLGDG